MVEGSEQDGERMEKGIDARTHLAFSANRKEMVSRL